jgi:c-di-GMP-binding flagellar brake protein YcgR
MADKSDHQSPSTDTLENRRFRRVSVRFEIEYSGRSVSGTGTVQNISSTGALIEDADPPLLSGGEVTLRFSIFEDSAPITIRGKVVRETENGFGVEFVEMDPRTRKVLKTAVSKALKRESGSGEDDTTLLRVATGPSRSR